MKFSASEVSKGGPDQGEGLSFDWKRRSWLSFRLVLLIFLSILAHAFCFYLFQVVDPPSERFTPATARIMLLSPNDSRSREMLREVDDRVVYFDSSNRGPVRENSVRNFAVAFRPSFADYDLKLELLSPSKPSAPLPEPFEPWRLVLPPESTSSGSSGAGATATTLPGSGSWAARQGVPRIKAGEALQERAVLERGDWMWAIERRAELEGHRTVLMVGVTARGIPQHVLVNSGIESTLDAKIAAAVRGMRFEPETGSELKWITLRLQW